MEWQVVFDYYILDFVLPNRLLVVEIDGESHTSAAERAHNAKRDRFCQRLGLAVLRIPNRLAHTADALVVGYPAVEGAAKQ